MKVTILNIDGKEKGSIELPVQFKEEKRADIIKKVKMVQEGNERQPYGAKSTAGMEHAAELSRRRHDYRGSYGHGISRVPRKIMSRRGTRFNWVGAVAPGTVGGRRAHPPKAEKIWNKKINVKERRLAIRSAMSINMDSKALDVTHLNVPEKYPFVLSNDYEGIKKSKEVINALIQAGLEKELERGGKKTIRPGKGKGRGRKYKKSKGPLIVVGNNCDIQKSAKSIAGIEVIIVNKLNVKALAPGAEPGRITLYTENAIKKINEEGLFLTKVNKKKISKVKERKEATITKKKEEIKKEVKTEKKIEKVKKPEQKK